MKTVPFDELAKLRNSGMQQAANDGEDDQRVKQAVVELIVRAAQYRASDIHLMVREGHSEIQIVVKGGLRVLKLDTEENGARFARAIYQGIAKVRDTSFNVFDFQNAQIPGNALPQEAGLTSVRIIRGPSYPQSQGGQFMTLRLQYGTVRVDASKAKLPPLELPRKPEGYLRLREMGLTDAQVEKMLMLMDAPNGVVMFTGPTGSGKTTVMFECLKDIARTKPHRRLVTIEDPIEYPMEWGVQLAVTDARNEQETGAAFSERLRASLRMAPNIILVGELRGPDVAAAAIDAALTGHQVWTTVHVTDPFTFVDRLEMMDSVRLNRKVFCDPKTVRGVVGVRLLAELCPHCSVPIHDQERLEELPVANRTPQRLQRIVKALATWGDTSKVRVKGTGCDACGGDATIGRFSVAEVVVTDEELMKDLIEHGSTIARERYHKRLDADPSMIASSIGHVLNGKVDPRDAEEVVDLIKAKGAE
jgi:type II secretory ATPase GspE/PulE/Tfp pilus assembly ATPase PilB-like protein